MRSGMREYDRCPAAPCALAGLLLVALAASGCTAQQAYRSGQAWQRQACTRVLDAQERDRCSAATGPSYDDYRREAEALKRGR